MLRFWRTGRKETGFWYQLAHSTESSQSLECQYVYQYYPAIYNIMLLIHYWTCSGHVSAVSSEKTRRFNEWWVAEERYDFLHTNIWKVGTILIWKVGVLGSSNFVPDLTSSDTDDSLFIPCDILADNKDPVFVYCLCRFRFDIQLWILHMHANTFEVSLTNGEA